jgi:hypothetical protein
MNGSASESRAVNKEMVDTRIEHRLLDERAAALHLRIAETRIFLLDDHRQTRIEFEIGLGH